MALATFRLASAASHKMVSTKNNPAWANLSYSNRPADGILLPGMVSNTTIKNDQAGAIHEALKKRAMLAREDSAAKTE